MKTTFVAKAPLFFFVLLVVSSAVYAQETIKWLQGNKSKSEYALRTLSANSEGFVAAVTVGTFMKPLKEIRILKYDREMQLLNESIVQGATSQYIKMGSFHDLVWIKDLPSVKPGSKEGKTLTFYDHYGQIVQQHSLDQTYNYQIIKGNIAMSVINNDYSDLKLEVPVFESTGDNYLILWGYRDEMESKKADKDHSIIVYVFDSKGNLHMTETIIFESVFGYDAIINHLVPDITPAGELLLFVRYKEKPNNARFSMAYFHESGTKPRVYTYNFPYVNPVFAWSFGETNEVYLTGTVSAGSLTPSVTVNKNRLLFFIPQDLNQEIPAKVVTYELNADFYARYPEYSKGKLLSRNLTWPSIMATCSDGFLYVSENTEKVTYVDNYSSNRGSGYRFYGATTSSSGGTTIYKPRSSPGGYRPGSAGSSGTYSYSSNLSTFRTYSFTIIKFDLSGNIQWIKMINKQLSVKQGHDHHLDWAWSQDGDAINLLYSDHPLNVTRPKGKMVKMQHYADGMSQPQLGTANARIEASGEITIKVINDPGKTKVYGMPYMMDYFNNGDIVMAGFRYNMMGYPDFYFGTVHILQ